MRAHLATVLVLAALLAPACDEEKTPAGLTLTNVVELLELGYSDAEVRAEIEKSGAAFALDAAAEEKLRAAGAGEALLSFLRKEEAPAAARDGVAEILAAVKAGEPVGKTLDRIALRPPRPLSAEDRAALDASGAPLAVRLALLGTPLGLPDLDALAAAGTAEPDYGKLLAICGATGEKIPAPRAIGLLRAGVPKSALEEFRKGAGAKRAPVAGAAGGATTASVEGPAVRQAAGADGYLHVGRRFRVRCPADWAVLRDVVEGRVRYVFTPEEDRERVADVNVGIVLTLAAPPEGSVWADRDPRELLERMLPFIRLDEPDMAPSGEIEDARLGDLPAAALAFEGSIAGREGRFRTRVHVAGTDGLVYSAVTIAPAAEHAKWEEPMRKVLEASEFGRLGHRRRGEEIDASALAERYKGSIVMVNATTNGQGGFGTGFIISRDGYLLTNWHVVWNTRLDRLNEKVTIRFDDSLRRPALEAEVLGTYHRYSGEALAGGMIGGVDVALLKLPPGDYEPVPLTPLSEVRLGDPVVAIGFPQTGRVAGLSLFVTRGVVVRFNRDATGKSQSIATDAKIAPGNSGGPCFSLRTGGVVGLNTWSYKIGSRDMSGEDARDLVGYYFVCPTDAAFEHFPLVADLGLPHDAKLDFVSWFELGSQFLALAAREEAVRAADRAVELDPRNADALVLRGYAEQALAVDRLGAGETEEAMRLAARAEASFDRATIAAPDRADARIALAALLVAIGREADAEKHAERAVADFPDRWDAHLVLARIAAAREKYDVALREIAAAKRTSRDLVPDPYVLGGLVAYDRGWLEEGKAEFEGAVRIHPRSLEARLGIADYYRAKGRFGEAIAEYERVRDDFPTSPHPLHRIAFCLKAERKFDEALVLYAEAHNAFQKNGIEPPEGFYLEMADIYAEKGDKSTEIAHLAHHLARHDGTPGAVPVHLRAARLFRDLGIAPGATLHVRRAVLIEKEAGRKLEPEGFPEELPGLAHLALLQREAGYAPTLLANLVVGCRLAYEFPKEPAEKVEKEFTRLVEEVGLHPFVVEAIRESNRRYPPKAAAAPPGPGTPGQPGTPGTPGPTPANPPEAENPVVKQIVGTWRHRSTDPILGEIDLTMTFTADGQWSAKGVTGGFRVDDGGTYTVSGNTIRTVIQRSTNPVIRPGTPGTFSVEVNGNTLRLTGLAGGNWMEFSRQ